MKAKILPLKGKYYGTEIEVVDDNGLKFGFTLWNSSSWTPSSREDYEDDELCDTHFESKETYELAQKIVNFLNG